MKIAVVGAGAVGGWYGGHLAEHGHDVHLVTRTGSAVIAEQGLRLRDRSGERVVRVASASATSHGIGPCDLVIVAAKATANPTLPPLLHPLIGPATILLTLQNGMGNVEALGSLLPPERLVAGLCFVCLNRQAPGLVENTLAGNVRMAATIGPANDAVRTCVAAFTAAGIDCRAEESLEGVLWKKLCWNVPFNGLSIAAGGVTTDRIVGDPSLRSRARRLMDEVAAAALARGHGFDEKHIRWQLEMTDAMGPYRPSSLIDYLAGREVEVEGIWGEPLRRGEAAGVAMPEMRALLDEIRGRLASRDSSLLR